MFCNITQLVFREGPLTSSTATAEQKKYNPAHAGWVGIQTYTDGHGNLRVKTEVLVAGSSITGDAADDALLPE